jgi:hypothetical protein
MSAIVYTMSSLASTRVSTRLHTPLSQNRAYAHDTHNTHDTHTHTHTHTTHTTHTTHSHAPFGLVPWWVTRVVDRTHGDARTWGVFHMMCARER